MIIATMNPASQNLTALIGCFVIYWALSRWSCSAVRRGKPAIPRRVTILIPLAAYLFFLQLSLPLPGGFSTEERAADMQSYVEQNNVLRRDLDKARLDVEQLRSVLHNLLSLGWIAVIIIVSNWLQPRLDDRNWIHGGIRPPPDDSSPPP